jgi:hypothetical protein
MLTVSFGRRIQTNKWRQPLDRSRGNPRSITASDPLHIITTLARPHTHTGILVPLYILVLGFSPKRAIPLSNVTILVRLCNGVYVTRLNATHTHSGLDVQNTPSAFIYDQCTLDRSQRTPPPRPSLSQTTHKPTPKGGSIANVIAGMRNRHPYADRPLLDFTLILMMEPTTIVGAVVGSFANKARFTYGWMDGDDDAVEGKRKGKMGEARLGLESITQGKKGKKASLLTPLTSLHRH